MIDSCGTVHMYSIANFQNRTKAMHHLNDRMHCNVQIETQLRI